MAKHDPHVLKHVAETVLKRDRWSCVLCGTSNAKLDMHHVYYGGEADYTDKRDSEFNIVTLCRTCHLYKLHGGKDGEGPSLRQQCKDYLEMMYDDT